MVTNSNSGTDIALKVEIKQALNALQDGDLREWARGFFNILGYSSERTLKLDGTSQQFIKQFGSLSGVRSGTKTEKAFLAAAEAVHIIFQVTDQEIQSSKQMSLLAGENFHQGHAKSFLFMAVKLKPDDYARGKYAEMTREISKRFGMPVCVLFCNDKRITLAFAHRRESKKPGGANRDVLGKVSLIRGVDCANPHRAHLDILAELSLNDRLGWIEKNGKQKNFDGLLAAWLAKLDTEELNKRFYGELYKWFQRAVDAATFPKKGNKVLPPEEHVIRLITRILFIWFIKEKNLVEDNLFNEAEIRGLLKNYDAENGDSYYRVVLQNLFFATLNTEIGKRGFSTVKNKTHRNFSLYRYRKEIEKPDDLIARFEKTPFVNGGLFDCLDSFESETGGGYRIDCFSDAHYQKVSIPNRLFFTDQSGLFPLLNRYKFTVEENTPIEQEVALDPELLGKVFENLLAATTQETRETARKQTGSYYTPRAIVDYMVDEALVAGLAEKARPADGDEEFWRERLHYLLDYADACNDAKELFNRGETKGIIRAISHLKVLDPAVGSGAFPVGVLHKLTLALSKLDPQNAYWRELQKQRALKATEDAYHKQKGHAARAALLTEISDTFEHYSSDFGRKLYLIQNSIFGVDIQPVACQISKLRFFISLAIEQTATTDKDDNYGIKPLPNLETRFVAADTLIGLHLGGRDFTKTPAVKSLEVKLQQNRERHFNASTRRGKMKCVQRDKELRTRLAVELDAHFQHDGDWREAKRINDNEIQKLHGELKKHDAQVSAQKQNTLIAGAKSGQAKINNKKVEQLQKEITERQNLGVMIQKREEAVREHKIWPLATESAAQKREQIHGETRKIAAWDPYDQNAKADWFDAEWMFGERAGFDVVIGNPPYIQLQKDGGRLGNLYQDCGFKTFARTGDIYQLFYERGMELLKETQGTLAFITSNSWMRAKYGEKLREFFSTEHSPLRLIDVGKDAFEAIVDTNILLVGNGNTQQKCKAVDMDSIADKSFPPADQYWSKIQPVGDEAWSILSSAAQGIKVKIEQAGTPLKDWGLSIYRGVTTGLNEAFTIDQNKRDELIAADPKSAEIIKPVLRGRDIQRYQAQWAGKWVIATFPTLNIKINSYPAIKEHLLSFGKKRLEQTGEKGSRKKTGSRWFETQDNIAYHEEFKKEKLIWIELVDSGRFAYDNREIFCSNTAYVMTGENIKYLCAFLNSTTATWILNSLAASSGMGVSRWIKIYVEIIPVPKLDASKQKPFVKLVDKILAAKAADSTADTSKLEAKIDQLVYNLYGLTKREISLIESK